MQCDLDRKYIRELLDECFYESDPGELEWSFNEGVSIQDVVSPECAAHLLEIYRSTEAGDDD